MQRDCEIDVRFFAPPAEFDGCFTTFYRVTFTVPGGDRVEDYLQPEWANLRVFSGDLPVSEMVEGARIVDSRFTATGPSSRPVRFEMGTTRMWGVGLFPLGWARFVRLQASDHANQLYDGETNPAFARFAPLLEVMGDVPDDEAEFARLIEFFRSIDTPTPEADIIRAVHAAIVDTDVSSVGEIAERAGISIRALERICRKHFGFPPKLLLRRQRFMRSLAAFMLAGEGSWKAAIDEHYHDHAHFTREFRAFMHMTPSEYAALPHPVLGAFMAERERVWGSPAQTLDKPKRD
ncbi:helix-turn-helix domain-containing protein [Tsuneonella mangrovi]|uniref:helix-turn-helix domain-containing protein n=1 Tax=Tsuneonella mangrovi TaxID=1982042 RepID=UPI001F0B0CAA|nr:helix-turn-helix domain-containing protein [Tsuneonella mangrovi]